MKSENEKFDIVLLAGQSNAEGSGLGDDEFEFIQDDDVMIMRGDFEASVKRSEYGNEYLDLKLSDEYKITHADYLLNEEGQKKGCLAFSFAREYKKNNLENGRKILIVHTSIGGTGFAKNHWGVEDCLYNRMLNMLNKALKMNTENRLVAFLWHQGEHDSFENEHLNDNERQDYYYDKLTSMLVDFRNKYGNVPFVSAGFTRQWKEKYPNQCKAIYEATKSVVQERGNAVFITETEDLLSNAEMVGNQDQVHFCRRALSILGVRYYNEWLKLKKIK